MARKTLIFALSFVLILSTAFFIKSSQHISKFCANQISCIQNLSGVYDTRRLVGEFGSKIIAAAPEEIVSVFAPILVLGSATGEKRIEINLTNQHLYAYQGDTLVYDFPVSTGKWSETPTGTYNIWIKLRYTRMEGGRVGTGTYYNLPNVPYTMYFYNGEVPKTRGYGVHGAYWHNNFGHPMSHGCVNMKIEDVEKLYYWADPPSKTTTTYASASNPGTKIVIYGTTPKE